MEENLAQYMAELRTRTDDGRRLVLRQLGQFAESGDQVAGSIAALGLAVVYLGDALLELARK